MTVTSLGKSPFLFSNKHIRNRQTVQTRFLQRLLVVMSSAKMSCEKMMSDLPYKTMKAVAERLDLMKDGKTANWRELAGQMDYSPITVENFGLNAGKVDGSPGYSLLLDMSNRGVGYDELVSYLKRLEMYEALIALGFKEDVRIIKQPTATPVMVGQKLILECKAEGVPRPRYMWFKGQTPLPLQKAPKLVIDKVKVEDGGVYTCRAGNDANYVFSQWVEVQVQSPIRKQGLIPNGVLTEDNPKIYDHPQPCELEVGNKLYLSCSAGGEGQLEYQWFHNGAPLPFGTSSELTINSVQSSDQGIYVCCVKSSNGTSILTKGAEVLVRQPQMPAGFVPHNIPPAHISQFHGQPGQGMMEQSPSHGQPRIPHTMPGPRMTFPQHPIQNDLHHIPPCYDAESTITPTQEQSLHLPMMHTYTEPPPLRPMFHDTMMHYPEEYGGNMTRVITPAPGRSSSPPSGQPGKKTTQTGDEPAGQDYRCQMERNCSDKVALLIGNKNYHVETLKLNTPENDTQDLAGILRSASFKVVSLVNLTKKEMDDALEVFTHLLGPNVYALFFFAGHGFELNGMNYMMAVDCTKEKNPSFCVCAQKVLRMMQEKGAKLSIVLLDMCRVVAPQKPITDLSGIYEAPYPAKSYPGFHIYGFSCSPAEKAYEVAGGAEGGQDLGLIGKDNSIFVAAMKEHLGGRGSLHDAVQDLFNATAKRVHVLRPSSDSQWQRPEISSNLAEDLSLNDTIDPDLLPTQQEERSRRWKEIHTIPEPIVAASVSSHLPLRLNFQAEHSNVLVVQVEVLQGPLSEIQVQKMGIELILRERPAPWTLPGGSYGYDSPSSMAIEKGLAKGNLLHFTIGDLQKIASSEVTLHIEATFRWRDTRHDDNPWETRSDHIFHRMSPPPLYGKVAAFEEEQRRKQPHPAPHFMGAPTPFFPHPQM